MVLFAPSSKSDIIIYGFSDFALTFLLTVAIGSGAYAPNERMMRKIKNKKA